MYGSLTKKNVGFSRIVLIVGCWSSLIFFSWAEPGAKTDACNGQRKSIGLISSSEYIFEIFVNWDYT